MTSSEEECDLLSTPTLLEALPPGACVLPHLRLLHLLRLGRSGGRSSWCGNYSTGTWASRQGYRRRGWCSRWALVWKVMFICHSHCWHIAERKWWRWRWGRLRRAIDRRKSGSTKGRCRLMRLALIGKVVRMRCSWHRRKTGGRGECIRCR